MSNLIFTDSPDNAFHLIYSSTVSNQNRGFVLSHLTVTENGRAGQVDNVNDVGVDFLVENSIFFNNNNSDVELNGGSFFVFNNLEGIDPLFVDPASLDFHLQSASPAIDLAASQNFSVPIDLDGVARPQGFGFDAGAYEFPEGEPLIFADGFESGNTDAWSSTEP